MLVHAVHHTAATNTGDAHRELLNHTARCSTCAPRGSPQPSDSAAVSVRRRLPTPSLCAACDGSFHNSLWAEAGSITYTPAHTRLTHLVNMHTWWTGQGHGNIRLPSPGICGMCWLKGPGAFAHNNMCQQSTHRQCLLPISHHHMLGYTRQGYI
jgi:hypothetical protein